MSTNNKVFQVLVTKGDKALAVAGTKVDALTDGQLGIFDANTNLAVVTPVKEFYLAVGVDTDGDGTIDNIVTSAGQVIQSENVRDITSQEYTAPTPMEFEITDYDTVLPDTDYSVKLEFRNAQIYARQGYNQFAKTFSVRTSCVEADATPAKLTDLLIEAFEADESGMFKAEAITGGATLEVTTAPSAAEDITVSIGEVDVTVAVGASDTAAQAATKIATAINAESTLDVTAEADGAFVYISNASFGTVVEVDEGTTAAVVAVSGDSVVINLEDLVDGVNPGIRITTNSIAVNRFCDVNTMYYNPRQTVIIPSLIDSFNGTGVITITQNGIPEQGAGYDIKQKEYHAGGWNGKPGIYRDSSAIGLAMPGFEYLADSSAKYDQIHLVYDQFSTAGWGEYLNNLMTTIAVPTGGTVTLAALTAALGAMLPGFLPAE